ncbi:phosphotransferase family protein [Phytohabitans kaempferiae]|uniref:Phosphotransferase family protein n=1 Tax=Phytohabitans kaempferiae TaxID=1620943 RepID=A0ABV6M786_9ACTN
MSTHDELVRPDRLGPALAAATGDGRWRTLRAALVSGGKSNLTFLLSSAAGELVLRRPPSGTLLPKAHDMAREARVQRALAGTAVPVPQIVFEDLGGDLLGVPCYVMRRVPGHVLRDSLPDGYAPAAPDKVAMADALVDVLVDLHALDPYTVGLSGHGRPEGFYARQVATWYQQWQQSKMDDVPAIDALVAKLRARTPRDVRAAIVHGDYRLDNCLLDRHNPGRITAVLDWELSTLGHPLADVGMLLFYWTESGEPRPVLTPALTATAGFPGRRHLVDRYVARTGADLADLLTFWAYAHFKFAVIAQGVWTRSLAGTMADQDFGDLSHEVVRIAERGLELLENAA